MGGMSAKPTKAQRRYLEGFGVQFVRMPPTGPGRWALSKGLQRAGFCTLYCGGMVITPAGRAAINPAHEIGVIIHDR